LIPEPRLGRGEPAENVDVDTMYGRGGACHCWHGRGPKASSCNSFVLVAAGTRWRSTTVGRSSSGPCGGLWRCRARHVSPAQKTACVAEKKDCDVRAEMGHAKVVVSGREAVVVAMAMKTTEAAESPATASQD
jgi:hypothetical protein